MFTNPIESALFLPTAYRLVALLGGVLLILLVLAKGNLKNLVQDSLFQRWRVWVVIAPIFLLSVLSGRKIGVMALALLIVVVGGVYTGARRLWAAARFLNNLPE